METFFVYVLYSRAHDRLYIGYTTNLAGRLKSHNELATKGFTVRYRPWVLLHSEEFDSKREALAREKALKSGQGRQYIRTQLLPRLLSD